MGFSYSADIIRYRQGEHVLFNVDPLSQNSLARGELLRDVLSVALPFDRYVLAPDAFNLGKHHSLVVPDFLQIVGSGMDATRLINYVHSDKDGTGFSLMNCLLSDLTLDVAGPEGEDCRTVGFDLAGDWRVRASRCRFVGRAWVWYDWQAAFPVVEFDHCDFFSSRQCVSVMASGGSAGSYTYNGCRFYVDGSRSQDVGATSNPAYGIGCAAMLRGGSHMFVDSHVELLGSVPPPPSFLPRLAAISDTFESGPSPSTKISVMRMSVVRDNRGVPEDNCFDFDLRNPTVLKNARIASIVGTGSKNTAKYWRPAAPSTG
jgi:hypothetical protein